MFLLVLLGKIKIKLECYDLLGVVYLFVCYIDFKK